MKSSLMVSIIIGLYISAGVLYAVPKGKPFVELQGQIVEVEGTVSTLKSQVDELLLSVDTLEGRVSSLDDNIATINAAIEKVKSDNAAVLAEMTTVLNDAIAQNSAVADALQKINELHAQVQELMGSSTANAEAIADLYAQIGTLEEYIAANAEGYHTLEAKIDHNQQLIDGLNGRLSAVEAEMQLKQSVLNATCQEGEALRQINPDGSYACTAATPSTAPAATLGLSNVVVTKGAEVGGMNTIIESNYVAVGTYPIWGTCSTGGFLPHDYSCIVGYGTIYDYVTTETYVPITEAKVTLQCPQQTLWTYSAGFVIPEGVSLTAKTLKRQADYQQWEYDLLLPSDGVVRYATFSAQCVVFEEAIAE